MAKKPTATQVADDEQKSVNKIKGYKITVKGQYWSVNSATGAKGPKTYSNISVYLPEIITYRQGNKFETIMVDGKEMQTSKVIPDIQRAHAKRVGLYIIKNHHIEPILREKFDDFVGLRVCRISAREEVMIDEADFLTKPIMEMTEPELTQFVAVKDINIHLSMYGDFISQKDAVIQALEDKIDSEKVSRPRTPEEIALLAPGEEHKDPLAEFL